MGPRLRKTLKVTGWSFGGLLMLLVAFVGLLAFPGFMFAHQLEYRNITVHSDEDLRGSIEPILAKVDEQLASSELYAPSLEYDLFFGHDNLPFRALDRARWAFATPIFGLGRSPTYSTGWPPYINHVICLDRPDGAHDALLREAWPGRRNMTHVLTHEMGHNLVYNRMGVKAAVALPFWKTEGYPEYVASHAIRTAPGYELRSSVTRMLTANLAWLRDDRGNFQSPGYRHVGASFLKDENGDQWHTSYYVARVLVEYSLDVKGLSFEQLTDPAVRDVEVMRELLADYGAGKL